MVKESQVQRLIQLHSYFFPVYGKYSNFIVANLAIHCTPRRSGFYSCQVQVFDGQDLSNG